MPLVAGFAYHKVDGKTGLKRMPKKIFNKKDVTF